MKQSMSKRGAFAARPLAFEISRMFGPPSVGFALLAAMTIPAAYADPQGGSIVAGQALIAKSGSTTTITQASQRAAIDWRSFNVGATETVKFQQPNTSSSTLNRVVGSDASAIFGRITANGTVLLINPNGILFGRTAQVDVGGLVASTANITNADFIAGRMAFTQPGNPGASVENQGSITIGQGGFAALVGRGVSNSGVIQARLGKVSLAAGDAFVLDLYGDKLVNLIVDPVAMATLTDASGLPLAARVDHSGNIVAEGGVVQLTAGVVRQLVDNIINVSGTIRATSFDTAPGLISLRGDAQTKLAISGRLDVAGVHGGRIEVTARDVALSSTAVVDASGSHGGGVVAIGGDWQGRGALLNAQTVSIDSGARVDASATSTGAGGTVSIWADGDTRFAGLVTARGGDNAGDGGKVEVSGKGRLGFEGDVDASAQSGRAGMLLLDPTNLLVAMTGADALPAVGASGDFTVAASALRKIITQGNTVSLQATQDISINAVIDGRLPTGGVAGGGLAIDAGRNVAVNQNVILNDAPLTVNAGGRFTQAASTVISTGSGALTVNSVGDLHAAQVLSRGDVALTSSSGSVAVSASLIGTPVSAGVPASVGSLSVSGARGIELSGARVDRTITLQAGGPLLSHGTLQAGGDARIASSGDVALDDVTAAGFTLGGNLSGVVASGGALIVSGAVVVSGAIGVKAGTDIVLTSASGLHSGGDTRLAADRDIVSDAASLRSEGLLKLSATRDLTLRGETGSRGGATLSANGKISIGGNVAADDSALTIQAGTGYAQAATAKIGSGSGALSIRTTSGDLSASQLLSGGAMTLTADAGRVDVSQSLIGPTQGETKTAVGSLEIIGATGVALVGARVTGPVNISSGSGSILVAAPAGTGAIDAAQAAVILGAQGSVELDSATVGSLTVRGAQTGAGTAGFVVHHALVSHGNVDVRSAGNIALLGEGDQPGVTMDRATGSLRLSAAGTLSSAVGALISSSGLLELRGDTALTLNGTVASGGAVDLASAQGSITVNGPLDASGSLVRLGAGRDVSLQTSKVGGLVARSELGGSTPVGGSITLNGAVISSGTVDLLAAGDIAIEVAGDKSGLQTLEGHLDIHAGGALSSAAGTTIDARGGATMMAEGELRLGGRSLFVGAANLTAGTSLTVGQSVKVTGGALTMNATAGSFIQDDVIASGTEGMNLSATGGDFLSHAQLRSDGAMVLTSTRANGVGGTVDLAKAPIGLDVAAGVGSLRIEGSRSIALHEGARAAGDVTLVSSAGGIAVQGVLEAAKGAVKFAAAGDVSVEAANVASLTVRGPASDSAASGGNFTSAGTIYSSGDVDVKASGKIAIQAATGTSADGKIDAANIRVESMSAAGSEAMIQIMAGQDQSITDASKRAAAGGLHARSANGAGGTVSLIAVGDIVANGSLRTDGGKIYIESTAGNVSLHQLATNLPGVGASGTVDIRAQLGNVVLKEGLGGAHTGYLHYAEGYLDTERPAVGSVAVLAGNAIETHGLNLDGTNSLNTDGSASPPATGAGYGLSLRTLLAGSRIIINDQVAVNKGDVQILAPGGDVLLGASIYSRGYDPAVHAEKIGYAVRIDAQKIGLWDNDSQIAFLPDTTIVNGALAVKPRPWVFVDSTVSPAVPYYYYNEDGSIVDAYKAISKISVANNAANYYADGSSTAYSTTLVKVTNPTATIALAGQLYGLNDIPADSTINAIQPISATGLLSDVHNSIDVGTPKYYVQTDRTKPYSPANSTQVNKCFVNPGCGASQGLGVGLKLIGFRTADDISTLPKGTEAGSSVGRATIVGVSTQLPPSGLTQTYGSYLPGQDGPAGYFTGQFVSSENTSGSEGTRLFVYSGVVTAEVTTGIIDGKAPRRGSFSDSVPSNSSQPVSYAAIGSFVASGSGNGAQPTGIFGGPITTVIPTGSVDTVSVGNSATVVLVVPRDGVLNKSSFELSAPGASPPVTTQVEDQGYLARQEITVLDIGVLRAASEADLGRQSGISGKSRDVFGRTYLLGKASNPAVCAPGVLQSTDGGSGTCKAPEVGRKQK